MEMEERTVDYDWDDDFEECLIHDDFDAEAEYEADFRMSGHPEATLVSF
jgi:hypothetical protein